MRSGARNLSPPCELRDRHPHDGRAPRSLCGSDHWTSGGRCPWWASRAGSRLPLMTDFPPTARHDDALLRRFAAKRDPVDLEALVLRYRPLARSLARRHARGPGGLEDLEQVACLGLVKAIQGFDPARGFAFSTYAVPTIAGELKRWYRQTAWAAHVPRRVQERVVAVRATADRLTTAQGRPATAEAVARALRCEIEDVIDALCAAEALMPVSLDGAAGTDADAESRSRPGRRGPRLRARGGPSGRRRRADAARAATSGSCCECGLTKS